MLGARGFGKPDETRNFAGKGKIDVIAVAGVTAGRGVFEPGWKWSENVKPIVGGNSCQAAHAAYVLSGRMKVVMDDGAEGECGPGDVFVAGPGHDAWVVGNEACVMVDFGASVGQYAKRS